MPKLQVKGIDISTLAEVEACGGSFKADGAEVDLFDLAARHQVDTIRLRLWVDPYDADGAPYLGGTNDLETTLVLARRASDRGLRLLLNLHYSDFWTDPKKQSTPKAWAHLTGDELEDQVETYTRDVVARFVAEGLTLDMVQIGNEITHGMLWPYARTTTYLPEEQRFDHTEPDIERNGYDRLARLLRRGIDAVRAAAPDAKTVIHLDYGGATELYRGWLAEVLGRGVEVDIVALSYYPFWHGTLDDLSATMKLVVDQYDVDVLVVETAYAHRPDGPVGETTIFNAELAEVGGFPATVQGQHDYLVALMQTVSEVSDGHGLGIVYWEPAWLPVPGTSWASLAGMTYGDDVAAPGNPWANQALFDFDGHALPSWSAFQQF